MFEPETIAEADRQFAVCNACRYCESFCAVFPAVELRTAVEKGDLGYLASLCHDCKMCYDACMFTPPHEYAINIPEVLAEARIETYETYSGPAFAARMFRSPRAGAIVAVALGMAVVFAAIGLTNGFGVLKAAHTEPGAFYHVFPYLAMVIPALALGVYGFVVLAIGARRYARDIRSSDAPVTWPSVARAIHEALALVYMKGGGVGCYDVDRGSQRRRLYHSLVFWGFLSDLASTTSAFVYQDFFGWLPPYPLLSLPVVLGTAGGIAIVIGTTGLAFVKRASDARPMSPAMMAMDYAFLGLLFVVALTGLALLVWRSTAAMGPLLGIHLGAVFGLFATMPYGKFVHFIYRFIALVQHATEQRAEA